MRDYQWMFAITLTFCGLGGYTLVYNIPAGIFLISIGFITLFYKWKLQSDELHAKSETEDKS